MKDLQTIIDIIQEISVDRKIPVSKMLLEGGTGKDLIADMRKGQIPSVKKFADLADYLDISVDYLLGRTSRPEVNR